MYDFYWYPKCSTCRKAKAKLDELGIDYQAIDLKETPPSQKNFEKWFKEADFPIKKFFNTSGLVYRDLNLKDKLATLSEKEMAELLSSKLKKCPKSTHAACQKLLSDVIELRNTINPARGE